MVTARTWQPVVILALIVGFFALSRPQLHLSPDIFTMWSSSILQALIQKPCLAFCLLSLQRPNHFLSNRFLRGVLEIVCHHTTARGWACRWTQQWHWMSTTATAKMGWTICWPSWMPTRCSLPSKLVVHPAHKPQKQA